MFDVLPGLFWVAHPCQVVGIGTSLIWIVVAGVRIHPRKLEMVAFTDYARSPTLWQDGRAATHPMFRQRHVQHAVKVLPVFDLVITTSSFQGVNEYW